MIEVSQTKDKFMVAKFNDSKGRETTIFGGLQNLAKQVELRMNDSSMVVFDDNVGREIEEEFCGHMLSIRDQQANK